MDDVHPRSQELLTEALAGQRACSAVIPGHGVIAAP